MKKAAQNTVEISLLVVLVVIVGLSVLFLLNNKKLDFTNLAKVTPNVEQSSGGSSGGGVNNGGSGVNSDFSVEAAASLAGVTISKAEFEKKAQDLSLEDVSEKSSQNGMNIIQNANSLIEGLGLKMDKIQEGSISTNTLTQLAQVLSLASEKKEGSADLYNIYVAQFKDLID